VSVEECELFRGLSSEFLERIKSTIVEREFDPDETIFEEGDDANELFILAQGEVELSYTLPNDRKVSIGITKVAPGELFGWSAAAGGKRLTAKACSASDSCVYAIDARRFHELLGADPKTGYTLMCRIAQLARLRMRDTRFQLRWMQSWA